MATSPVETMSMIRMNVPQALLCPYCGFFCNDAERVTLHIEQKHIKPYPRFFSPLRD